jgi:hypothetical protein
LKFFLLPAALALALSASNAAAQMMLPGALQAAPEGGPAAGAPAAPSAAFGAAKPKPAAAKPPGDEAILDRDLARNGSDGLMRFGRTAGAKLEITALSLAGDQISHPGEACRLEVVAGAPIEAKANGRPQGLLRYDVGVEACPFSLDVLDGAVLVAGAAKACDFPAADCRVELSGLWGPAATALDDKQIKRFEHARGVAESTMRSNFRALLAGAGADKTAVKAIASEQAGFSSEREVICRGYAGEDAHGFCHLRLTQARAFALQARRETAPRARRGPEQEKDVKAKESKAEAKKEARP